MSDENVKILLAEDEPNFGTVLKSYLNLAKYDVDWCINGQQAYSKVLNHQYHLCIFDVMMPEMDGFALAKEVRKKNKEIPIIFLTARGLKEDVLKGFKLGADDYLTKPFDSDILLEKIKVLLKRNQKEVSDIKYQFEIGQYNFDYSSRSLTFDSEEQRLSPKEADLLALMCQNINSVIPRSEALKKIWKEDNYFTGRSMDVYIAKLRKHLLKDEKIKIINIHGNGFTLKVN